MPDEFIRKFGRNDDERQWGRIPSSIDRRDWALENFIPAPLKFVLPQAVKWDFNAPVLDQGNTPFCVGFSMAHFGINLPTFTMYSEEEATEMYFMCKVKDGDPRGMDGTTIRSAAKVLQDLGAIDNYAFASNIESIKWWLLNRGPLIMGTIWTEGMMKPDADNNLDVSGFVLGGHAYLLNELTDDNRVGIKNSWGPKWGVNGKAYMRMDDFLEIFLYGGEALGAVERENYKAKKKTCWLLDLFKKVF